MKIAFDIGGVISKYPNQFRSLINSLTDNEIFIITDMHDKSEVIKQLKDNQISVDTTNVYCADYQKHGEYCKAVLLKELGIDIFIDDFMGYLQWDVQLGKAPIRLLVMPDGFSPYWSETWKVSDKTDFGRRVAPETLDV